MKNKIIDSSLDQSMSWDETTQILTVNPSVSAISGASQSFDLVYRIKIANTDVLIY